MPDRLQTRRGERSRAGVAVPAGASERRELGRQALLGGDAPRALWHLRHAVEADRNDAGTWRLLGRCFEEIGEPRRASMCYAVASRQALRSGDHIDELDDGPLALGWDRLDTHDA